jgi:hypothetical protein
MRRPVIAMACLAVLVAAQITLAAFPARASDAWRRDAIWDDGKAEFCAYEVTWARYGHTYPGRALLVLVKEPWAPEEDVKADSPRPGGFDVLKLNHVRDVPTGIYTYHQMASVFVRRDTGALQKIAASSTEACGVSTAEMTRGVLQTHSYFDGQADRSQPWPVGLFPEDGLPATLRDYVDGTPVPANLTVFPSLLMGRFGNLAPVTYRLGRREAGSVTVPAGSFAAVEIRLEQENHWLSYVFDASSPHRLLRFQRDDGTEYRLAKSERLVYWQMHDPGGEAWLPATTR